MAFPVPSQKTLAAGGVVGIAVLMAGSFAIAAKTKPADRYRKGDYPTATVNHPVEIKLGVDPEGTNTKLGIMQKRAAQSASRVVEAGRKRKS